MISEKLLIIVLILLSITLIDDCIMMFKKYTKKTLVIEAVEIINDDTGDRKFIIKDISSQK